MASDRETCNAADALVCTSSETRVLAERTSLRLRATRRRVSPQVLFDAVRRCLLEKGPDAIDGFVANAGIVWSGELDCLRRLGAWLTDLLKKGLHRLRFLNKKKAHVASNGLCDLP